MSIYWFKKGINMNLGIYLPSLADHNRLKEISDTINTNIGKNITDASIFYDDIAFNPFEIKCGMFNSTDLWNFKGKLITLSLQTTIKASKIVNDIDLYYYYGFEEKINPLSLIFLLSQDIKIVATSDAHANDLYRKTKTKPTLIAENLREFIEKVDHE